MDIFGILAIGGLVGGMAALVYILAAKPVTASPIIPAMLSAGFAAYTAVQIWQDGITMFWTNHTVNLTGIQVWWDLVMCVMIALLFVAPRARKMNMNVVLWALFVGCTASIGLLAMVSRLFWLEQASAAEGSAARANPA